MTETSVSRAGHPPLKIKNINFNIIGATFENYTEQIVGWNLRVKA